MASLPWCYAGASLPENLSRGWLNLAAFLRKSAWLLVILLTASPVLADGTSDNSNLILSVPARIKISGVGNLGFTYGYGGGSIAQSDGVCIYTNEGNGRYKVTGSGEGTGGSYVVKNTANTAFTLGFSVSWSSSTDTASAVELAAGTSGSLTGRLGADTGDQSCSGGNNAAFVVTFIESAFAGKPAGVYQGKLVLLVEPG